MRVVASVAVWCLLAATPSIAQPDESAVAFERLKKLSGTWEVVESRAGRAMVATYVMTGRGSVLMESIGASIGDAGMQTAYHLDKGTLVLTHFCGAGNQPRMRLKSVADGGRRLRFEMYDITNLADPKRYHSTAADVAFLSDTRVDVTFEGSDKSKQTFSMTRQSEAVVRKAQSAARTPSPANSNDAFSRLKTLVGTWDVTERDNPNTRELATYTMGSGGVLSEDLRAPAGTAGYAMGHMFTSYHLDKGQLVMTHFCGAGNQPRMRLRSVGDSGKRLSFELYDITNLADPKAYHSDAVEIIFLSNDRVDLVYNGRAGEKTFTQIFQLKRQQAARRY
jgi:phosphotransferase system IIB component